MKVLFVANNAFNKGNGIAVSIHNTMKGLKELGIDARLMAVENPDPEGPQPDFPLEHFVFPIFEPIIQKNGFSYAKLSKRRIREAVRWADVIHMEEALILQPAVEKIARKEGVPCVGTFHLYPHSVLANLGFPKKNYLNAPLQKLWNSTVFDHCSIIQCPAAEVKRYLTECRSKAELRVIPNGINIPEEKVVPEDVIPGEVIDILCIGRLSKEKSQDTLLQAMRYSRHADRIRLIFAGDGPMAGQYKKMAAKLVREGVIKNSPVFGFYTHEELSELARKSYLYVHCSWVETEGLSCLEATREGLVPVIGEGELVSTSQFALTPVSKYPLGDSKALAERIDWWIEHPAERNRMAREYADAARKYDISSSMQTLAQMYEDAIKANKKN